MTGNDRGNQVSHTRYYPYGQVWTQENASLTDKAFDGYTQEDVSSGLYHAGARFCSATSGGSCRPTRGNYGDPQSLNPYSYVMNNPLTLTDPTGAALQDAGGGGLSWRLPGRFQYEALAANSSSAVRPDAVSTYALVGTGAILAARQSRPRLSRRAWLDGYDSSGARAMQSATGLLYLAMVLVICGEVVANGLLFVSAVPN